MDEYTRMLVLIHDHDTWTASILAAYAVRHDLHWDLTVLDRRLWLDSGRARNYEPGRFEALISWWPLAPAWASRSIPRVVFGGHQVPGTINLRLDRAAVGRLAARHFHAQGYRCVGTTAHWNLPVRTQTFAAFFDEARRLGLTTLRHEPPIDGREQNEALARWLRTVPHPIGILLHQDRDALHLQLFCQENALAVPDQVAILGVDDVPVCAAVRPSLSSIALPRPGIATLMADQVHRLLNGASCPAEHIITPLRVIARQSTAPANSDDMVVNRIRRRMSQRPGGRHDLPTLARVAGMSASQLHRRFRAATGITPGAWLDHCRIELAQALLADTAATIATVAKRCGLGSASSLWHLFRRAGLPAPTHWRKLRSHGSGHQAMG